MQNSGAPCLAENTLKNLPKSQPRPANENIINISMPSHDGLMQRQAQTVQQIQIDPQPIKLSIDNSIDWPNVLIGFGSILTAVVVGFLTYINQKRQVEAQENQTKATAATFRADWQLSLRNAIAKFISHAALIKFELDSDSSYLTKKESNEEYSSMIESQVMIELLLDPSKRESDQIKNLVSGIIADINSTKTSQIEIKVNELVKMSAALLEKAWQDIQKDLYKKSITNV